MPVAWKQTNRKKKKASRPAAMTAAAAVAAFETRLRKLENRLDGVTAWLDALDTQVDDVEALVKKPDPSASLNPAPSPSPAPSLPDPFPNPVGRLQPLRPSTPPSYLESRLHSLDRTSEEHYRLCCAITGYRSIRLRTTPESVSPIRIMIDVQHPDLPDVWVTVIDTLMTPNVYSIVTSIGILQELDAWESHRP